MNRTTILKSLLLAGLLLPAGSFAATYDVVVYGGTSAGVISAVQAKRMGKSVIIVCPDKHLGGLSGGGLGFTDTGNKSVIGGLAREFYHRVWKHYDQPDAWQWQTRNSYGGKGQGTPAIDGAQRTMWIFEPHVAEQIFEDFVKEEKITVRRDRWLDREDGVEIRNGRIASITMLNGETYAGRMFIDATYEGDLMAAAGVNYTVGRDSRAQYGEKWNGVQTGVLHHRHHFGAVKKTISPYVVAGDPSSGVLPGINPNPPGEFGVADDKVQAYCYRMCLTRVPENRVPFAKPDNYDPWRYELLVRIFDAGWTEAFSKYDPIPNKKTDTNNHGPFNTDNIGMNYDYPDATYARRREILKEHRDYQQGLLYFIANDPRVPEKIRVRMSGWGLAKDEFVDTGNWPHQIYVREARRMIGKFVMTENELMKRRPTPESVGMGSYTIDSHNVQRYITPEGFVQNEGDIGTGLKGPYEIAYGSLVPKKNECENLLVPVCVSATHIAFGSIRMEPVFMILGQSAATAAVMAIDQNIAVQDVEYDELREALLKDGQILKMADVKSAASGITEDSRIYKQVDGQELELWWVKPAGWKATDQRPAIVFFHGGGWTGGPTAQFRPFAKHLAQRGMVAFYAQYRLLDKGGGDAPDVCIEDAKSALRYVRALANDFGVDPGRIAAGGGSAGGHLAAATGLIDGLENADEDLRISSKADALVLFNPVFNNGPGEWGHNRVGDRYPELSPFHNISRDGPPTLVMSGSEDALISPERMYEFQKLMREAGVRSDVVIYDGAAHGFFNKGRDGDKFYKLTRDQMDEFLVSLDWLSPLNPQKLSP